MNQKQQRERKRTSEVATDLQNHTCLRSGKRKCIVLPICLACRDEVSLAAVRRDATKRGEAGEKKSGRRQEGVKITAGGREEAGWAARYVPDFSGPSSPRCRAQPAIERIAIGPAREN